MVSCRVKRNATSGVYSVSCLFQPSAGGGGIAGKMPQGKFSVPGGTLIGAILERPALDNICLEGESLVVGIDTVNLTPSHPGGGWLFRMLGMYPVINDISFTARNVSISERRYRMSGRKAPTRGRCGSNCLLLSICGDAMDWQRRILRARFNLGQRARNYAAAREICTLERRVRVWRHSRHRRLLAVLPRADTPMGDEFGHMY